VYRFTQPDSIIPNLYTPQSLNRYAYVLNNPVRYNDPTGHESVCGYAYSDPDCRSTERKELRTPVRTPIPYPPSHPSSTLPSSTPTKAGPSPYQIIPISTQTPSCPVALEGGHCIIPRQSSDFDFEAEFQEEISNGLDFIGFTADLLNSVDVVDVSFLFGLGVDGTKQYIEDMDNSDLSQTQKFTRSILVGGEGA
jgi:hypothetical protein